jgi:hypothetical protein
VDARRAIRHSITNPNAGTSRQISEGPTGVMSSDNWRNRYRVPRVQIEQALGRSVGFSKPRRPKKPAQEDARKIGIP